MFTLSSCFILSFKVRNCAFEGASAPFYRLRCFCCNSKLYYLIQFPNDLICICVDKQAQAILPIPITEEEALEASDEKRKTYPPATPLRPGHKVCLHCHCMLYGLLKCLDVHLIELQLHFPGCASFL